MLIRATTATGKAVVFYVGREPTKAEANRHRLEGETAIGPAYTEALAAVWRVFSELDEGAGELRECRNDTERSTQIRHGHTPTSQASEGELPGIIRR